MRESQQQTSASSQHHSAKQPQNIAKNAATSFHPLLQLQAEIGNRGVNNLIKQQQQRVSQQPIQAKPSFRGLSGELSANLPSTSTGGKELPEKVQQKMETEFGEDFSDVRIHEGSQAESIGAVAYTQGNHIHFQPGKYDPTTTAGQQLLGHELTHVVQQRTGQVVAPGGNHTSINIDPALEGEADSMGAKAAQGKLASVTGAGKDSQSSPNQGATNVIQRTEDDALTLANKYLADQEDYWTMCRTWDDIVRLRPDKFTNEQFRNLQDARAATEVRNGKGEVVPFEPLTETQKQDLADRKELLGQQSPLHRKILLFIEQQVYGAFGQTGVNEFYRGAHIIFNDDAVIYDQLFSIAQGLAAKTPQQQILGPNDVMDKTTAAGSAGQALLDYINPLYKPLDAFYEDYIPNDAALSADELASGKMFKRRAGTKETSHYGSAADLATADPNRPQLGIDFPLEVKGHLLFGVVPNGNGGFKTFVQTEGAGFQDLQEHIGEHGKGAIWNLGLFGNWQTGLIGYSKASEKRNTHLQE